MAVKFPLKMADGIMVRTLEELREHFDLTSVLAYYEDGKLRKWLKNGYYDDEAERLSALDAASENFKRDLCGILGVNYSESELGQVDLVNVAERNERINHLKQFTADNVILEAVDRVAFTQEELIDLLDSQVKEIYLCGKHFTIPENTGAVTYIGVNNPSVTYDGEKFEKGVDLRDLEFDLDNYVDDYIDGSSEGKRFFDFFDNDLTLGMKFLCIAAEKGSAKMQNLLGLCYENGHGVNKNPEEAVKWYKLAAEQGQVDAQYKLGVCYDNGDGVTESKKEAVKWYRLAAEQGNVNAQYILGVCLDNGYGIAENKKEAAKWYKLAAIQGDADAQYILGVFYYNGYGVIGNKKEAIKWYRLAAEQGNADAQYILGVCYDNGDGVTKSKREATKWYKLAAKRGNSSAVAKLKPKVPSLRNLFK